MSYLSLGIPPSNGVSDCNVIGFGSRPAFLGRESIEELTPNHKEKLRGRILQIFEEEDNVEVYMEDDDGNIEFVGRNRANGDQRGRNARQGRRKHGGTTRLSREEEMDKIRRDSSHERKRDRQRKRSSEKEANNDFESDEKRKDGLFPPSADSKER